MPKRGSRRRNSRRRRSRKQRGGAGPPATPLPFEKAYIITMDEHPERFELVNSSAKAAGIPLTKWPGVKVEKNELDKLPELGVGTTNFKDRRNMVFNLGVIGAFLAHRNLLEHIAAKGDPSKATMIMEDDVEFPPDFLQKYSAIASEIPDDWDYIFFQKMNETGDMISEHVMKLKRDMTAKRNWGFWVFLVKNSSIKDRILPHFEHMLDVPDIQLMKFGHKLNLYLTVPNLTSLHKTAGESLVSNYDKKS